MCLYDKHIIITIVNNFLGNIKNVDTCDVKIELYCECINFTLPSIVLNILFEKIHVFIEVSKLNNPI